MGNSCFMNDASQYRKAIIKVFPELAHAAFSVMAAGWDSIAVDADDAFVFKFPRNADAEARLRKEARILQVIQPEISMNVPALTLHEGIQTFSSHRKIRGAHLLTDQYRALVSAHRARLADEMARFYADLHGLKPERMAEAGAEPLAPWPHAERLRAAARALLPDMLRKFAQETLDTWERFGVDPYGAVFGFFDGHGWNMAFDHASGRLNGIYDFADTGIGPLHQEFIYSNFIDEDLTLRIIDRYEALTGMAIDRRRVETLTGVLRLIELANASEQPENLPLMLHNVEAWAHRERVA
jgi:Phosphotransferase enzyme family